MQNLTGVGTTVGEKHTENRTIIPFTMMELLVNPSEGLGTSPTLHTWVLHSLCSAQCFPSGDCII